MQHTRAKAREQTQATPEQQAPELQVLSENGAALGMQPLAAPDDGDLPFRKAMERQFGEDFGGVTVHTGQVDLQAQALALGEEVWFASAHPTAELVAHELTHVVQQRRAGRQTSAALASEGATPQHDPSEMEARHVGRAAAAGQAVQVSAAPGPGLHGAALATAIEPGVSMDRRLSSPEMELGPATFRVGGGVRFKAEPSAHQDDPDLIWLDLDMGLRVEGELSGELNLERESRGRNGARMDMGARASASVEGLFEVGIQSHRTMNRATWNEGHQGFQDVADAMESLATALEDLVELKENFSAQTVLSAIASVDRLLQDAASVRKAVEDLVTFVCEFGERAGQDASVAAADPDAARQLTVGESVDMVLTTRTATAAAASADGQLAGVGSASVGGSASASSETTRVLHVERTQSGVEVSITFMKAQEADDMMGGAVGPLSFASSHGSAASGDMRIRVRLNPHDSGFDQLFREVTEASTPDEVMSLTKSEDLKFHDGQGVLTLQLQSSARQTSEQSTEGASGEEAGVLAGGGRAQMRSGVTIDFEHNKVHGATVSAEAESYFRLNLQNTSIDDALDSLRIVPGGGLLAEGVGALLDAAGAPEFLTSRAAFEFGEAASLTGKNSTLAEAMGIVRGKLESKWVGSPKDLVSLAARARGARWDPAGAAALMATGEAVDQSFIANWTALGAALSSVHRGVANARFDVPGLGSLQTPDLSGHPDMEDDFKAFLVAQAIGIMIGKSELQPAATVFAMNAMLGQFQEGRWYTQGQAREIGVITAGSLVTLAGRSVGDATWVRWRQTTLELEQSLAVASDISEEHTLDRLQNQGEGYAGSSNPDFELMGQATGHLKELRHVSRQVRGLDISDLEDPYAATSMAGELQEQATSVTKALVRYQRSFGGSLEFDGILLHDEETGATGGTQSTHDRGGVMGDSEGRALSRQACEVALNLSLVRRSIAVCLDELEDDRTQSTHITKMFLRWDLLQVDFKDLLASGASREPSRACSEEIWDKAYEFPRDLRDRFKEEWIGDWNSPTYTYLHLRNRDALHDPDQVDDITEIEEPPVAADLFFMVDYPRPAADPTAQHRDDQAAMDLRSWRDPGEDRSRWGMTGEAAATAFDWARRVVALIDSGNASGKQFRLTGTADERDEDWYNQLLAYRRASAMRTLLIRFGVPASMLYVASLGESQVAVYDGGTAAQLSPDQIEAMGAPEAFDDPQTWASMDVNQRREALYALDRRVEFTTEGSELLNAPDGVDTHVLAIAAALLGSMSNAMQLLHVAHLNPAQREEIAALSDSSMSEIKLQPASLTRRSDYTVLSRSLLRSVGRLPWTYFTTAQQRALAPVIEHVMDHEPAAWRITMGSTERLIRPDERLGTVDLGVPQLICMTTAVDEQSKQALDALMDGTLLVQVLMGTRTNTRFGQGTRGEAGDVAPEEEVRAWLRRRMVRVAWDVDRSDGLALEPPEGFDLPCLLGRFEETATKRGTAPIPYAQLRHVMKVERDAHLRLLGERISVDIGERTFEVSGSYPGRVPMGEVFRQWSDATPLREQLGIALSGWEGVTPRDLEAEVGEVTSHL